MFCDLFRGLSCAVAAARLCLILSVRAIRIEPVHIRRGCQMRRAWADGVVLDRSGWVKGGGNDVVVRVQEVEVT